MNRLARVLLALSVFSVLALPARAGEGKVDINKASVEELDRLPGIGPSLAQRIVEFRKQNGPFHRVEDLLNVRGIGPKSFEPLRDKVMVSDVGKGAAPGGEAGKSAKAESK